MTWRGDGDADARIVTHADARPLLGGWLADPSVRLVGANVAYDLAVVAQAFPELLPAIFAAYANDRVTDVQLRQKLLDIAAGVYRGRVGEKGRWITHEYNLEALAKRAAGMVLQKDAWRLSYAEFLGVPLDLWSERAREVQARGAEHMAAIEAAIAAGRVDPKDAKEELDGLRSMVVSDPERCVTYPLDDARATLAVYLAQEKHVYYLADQFRQARAAWWLHLSSAWGLRTDPIGVEILRRETASQIAELEAELGPVDMGGIGLVREDGTRDTKAARARMIEVCRRDGIALRRTATHGDEGKCRRFDGTPVADGADECEEHVSLDADACQCAGDEVLIDYSDLSTLKTVLTKDCVALAAGIAWPVHTRYDLAETGRTTSSKPNIQNLRRKAGIREAFVPRPEHVFFAADYPQLELFTLAQCCVAWIGRSKLADALNSGIDPHLALAATVLGVSYDEAKRRFETGDTEADDARQLAKKANFGLPGGMGLARFELICRKELKPEAVRRLGLNVARLKLLKEQWFATWPELPFYFARVNALCDNDAGKASVESLFTQRHRGGAYYCAACNNGFQALGADCAKEAGFRIAKAQYVGVPPGATGAALFGTRTVFFVHDEFGGECRDDERAHDVAHALADLMVEGANTYLPDVPIPRAKVAPVLMRRWSKKAKPTFGPDGRLIPWDLLEQKSPQFAIE